MSDGLQQTAASNPASGVTARGIATTAVLLIVAAAILSSGLKPALEARRTHTATEQLLECCRSGDAAGARAALINGADANARDEGGRAAIYVVIEEGHDDVLEVLLEAGVDPVESGTNRPLHVAITAGRAPCLRLLLQAGADPNGETAGLPPLSVAIKKGSVDVADALIEAGADIRGALRDAAACAASADLVRMLLRQGADPYEKFGGITPMEAAVHFRAGDVADVLVEHGVPYTVRAAIALNRLDDVRRMVNADAALLTQSSDETHNGAWFERMSLLELAMSRGHRDIAQWLIDAGAPVELIESPDGGNLLHVAASVGDAELIRILAARGVDPNQPNSEGLTPIARASGDRAAVIAALVEAGADLDAPHPRFGTLLNHAARYHDQEMVRLLLKHGADPTIPNPRTGTLPIEYMQMPYYTGERIPVDILQLLEETMKQRATDAPTGP